MQVAGSAIKAVLFQLSHDLQPVGDSKAAASRGLEPLEQSSWSYYNPEKGKEVKHQLGCAMNRYMRCLCCHGQHAVVLSCVYAAWAPRSAGSGLHHLLCADLPCRGARVSCSAARQDGAVSVQEDEEVVGWPALSRDARCAAPADGHVGAGLVPGSGQRASR